MNRTADEALNRYYEILKQFNARGRDNLFAKLANSSVEESQRSKQEAQLTTDAVVVAGVRRSNAIADNFHSVSLTERIFAIIRPLPRVVLALLLLISVVVAFFVLSGPGSKTAWASMVDAIQAIQSAKYKFSVEMPNRKATAGRYWVMSPGRYREESNDGLVRVVDYGAGKILNLQSKAKTAVVVELTDVPKDASANDYFNEIRQDLLNEKTSPNTTRELLGKKKIESRDAIGYRIVSPERTTVIWGDSATGLPSRIEITKARNLSPGAKVTLSEFEFNAKLDESLFSVTPPAGYKIQSLHMSAAEPTEKELVDALDSFSERANGTFPKSLDVGALQDLAKALGLDKKMPEGKAMDEWMELCTKLNRGFAFALSLPEESRAAYAGRDVKRGVSDQPIFWYKPVGSTKYRIIQADLTIRESDNEPVTKNAKRLHGAGTPGKPD